MRRVEGAFLGAQRGKRSLALDLKSPDAANVVERLVRWADIVHHNIRMPAARRIGLASDQVMAIRPDLIFCHVSSLGLSARARTGRVTTSSSRRNRDGSSRVRARAIRLCGTA